MADDLKFALLRPLLKKLGLALIEKNFRPVSNLPFLSKLIERIVAFQLIDYVKQNNLYEPLQSAYKDGHSTETALLCVMQDLLMAKETQHVSILIMLDLSAAFDTIDHSLLLSRLTEWFGFAGKYLDWVSSYLSDRTQ